MNERQTDFTLLREFLRRGSQEAFATVVRRHIDLVYATALRKVEDAGAAQEIAQNVFSALARKAWQFAPDDSLPAWLYRTTLLETKEWLRGELRRRRREQTAAELGTTMKTPDEQAALRALVPLLDEALLSLREKDRTALLLRFYERQSLRDVGAALGVGEDAAQKRVGGALEKLAQFFQRRGFKTTTVAVAGAALQHTATSAPAATIGSVLNAAAQVPPAWSGLTALLARLAGLTKAQTAVLCLAVIAAPAAWQWNRLQAARTEAARVQSKSGADRSQVDLTRSEVDQLRARLQVVDAPAEPTVLEARNVEASRRLLQLKARLRALLTTPERGWPADLPFARIPRWTLKDLNAHEPAFKPPGKVALWVEEVLDLTADQKQATESNLAQFLGELDSLADGRAYETNSTSTMKGYTMKTISVPALGEAGERMRDLLVTNVADIVGRDRTDVVLRPLFTHDQWISMERMGNELIQSPQQFTLGVKTTDSGAPSFSFSWENHIGQTGNRIPVRLPDFLKRRFEPWVRGLGVTNEAFGFSP